MELPTAAEPVCVIEGDALAVLRGMPSGSISAVITDPPYPEISRPYGRWTEAEWFELMNPLVAECRRILKPSGSAVFILQPNSERVGRMRTWLWEFMAKWGREWGIVQDAWWWNYAAMPQESSNRKRGLLKPSLKACVWLGPETCWRDQDAVLLDVSSYTTRQLAKSIGRGRVEYPSGHGIDRERAARQAIERGGSAPTNLLPFANSRGHSTAGAHGHGAGTPEKLARWWTRYICPEGGTILDPFLGSGTMALAAVAEGRRCLGVERMPEYVATARRRVAESLKPSLLGAT